MQEMRPYSLTLLVHPQASSKENDEVVSLIQGWIDDHKGTVTNVVSDAKRRMAYPVQHLHQANYTTVRFSMPGQSLADLEQKIRRQKKVLRVVIHQREPRTDGKTLKDMPTRQQMAAQQKAGTAETPKKPKAAMKDLDSTIDEILEEKVL